MEEATKAYFIRKNIKYVLTRDHIGYTRIKGFNFENEYIKLTDQGEITGKKSYGWDGCSGPTKDDKTNHVPGLNHDIKYQLMRIGAIPESCRTIADAELKQECLDRKMNRIRAWYYFEGVDHFAKYAAKYGTEPKEECIA